MNETLEAICLQCGAAKRKPFQLCSACGFDPSADEDSLVKSVYLSVSRFDEPEQRQQYQAHLEQLQAQIVSGQPMPFDAPELERLKQQYHAVQSVSGTALAGALFRLFLPAFLFISALVLVYFLLRALH